jgi:glutamate synthase domain-containing protein 1
MPGPRKRQSNIANPGEETLCGIVGFLDKRGGQDRPVGCTILAMLDALGCRGPDSAGVALFGPPRGGCVMRVKLPETCTPRAGEEAVLAALRDSGAVLRHTITGACLRLELDVAADTDCLESTLLDRIPGVEVVSLGHRLQIAKQVGSPAQLERTYGISQWTGSHGIGHTRLSTESRVDLSHSQPFWAHGVPDLATVHNGHITNYHKLRRLYEQRGYRFFTENDSEVIGVYLRDRLAAGLSLEDALRTSLDDFDGSFCYLAASEERLAYVRDGFGFKPLVVAETNNFVAIATEEIALRRALGTDFVAREPAPGTMRVWTVAAAAGVRA